MTLVHYKWMIWRYIDLEKQKQLSDQGIKMEVEYADDTNEIDKEGRQKDGKVVFSRRKM